MALATFPMDGVFGPIAGSAERGSQCRVLRAEFGDGYSQRAADGINSVRDTYAVSWEGLSRTDANTIDTFLRTHGGHTAFKWTPPGASASRNWLCSEWRVRHSSATLDAITATFVEDFSVPPP